MKLPARSALVLVGGCLLAALAAAVNACFLVRVGTSVSHLTGDLSRLAIDLGLEDDGRRASLARVACALLGFVLGATVSGALIHHPRLELSRPYGRSITGIGLALVAADLVSGADALAVGLAGAACGFQNALATHFRGVILRTTHVTGLLTDLGVQLGMRLRGHEVEAWKVVVPLCLVLAFFAGAAGGAALTVASPGGALLVVGLAYVATGLGWTFVKHVVLKLGGEGPAGGAGAE